MNNTNQNHTDSFFKQGLNSPPELRPSEKNWQEMERLLKPEAQRRATAWIYPVSGIAAALLVFLTFWLASDTAEIERVQPKTVKAPVKDNEKNTNTNSILNSATPQDTYVSSTRSARSEMTETSSEDFKQTRLLARNNTSTPSNQISLRSADLFIADQKSQGKSELIRAGLPNAGFVTIRQSMTANLGGLRIIERTSRQLSNSSNTITKPKSPDRDPAVLPGKWALSLALSPDVNSVKGINNGDLGMSLGMGVSYRLGKALSLGTGIYYSKKLYSADKTSYKATEKPFATWTSYSKQIDADCRVIDVPLNLSVRLTNKTQNRVYATAGVSSYLMLSEKYDFQYNSPTPAFPTGRREYTVRNENNHLLSIANVGFALERPISEQVSLVIQPYAKLPLTGIGQGKTDLKSFGVGFRLNYSLKKKE